MPLDGTLHAAARGRLHQACSRHMAERCCTAVHGAQSADALCMVGFRTRQGASLASAPWNMELMSPKASAVALVTSSPPASLTVASSVGPAADGTTSSARLGCPGAAACSQACCLVAPGKCALQGGCPEESAAREDLCCPAAVMTRGGCSRAQLLHQGGRGQLMLQTEQSRCTAGAACSCSLLRFGPAYRVLSQPQLTWGGRGEGLLLD